MKGEQMDLFAENVTAVPAPRTATIYAFPVDRHLVYVRETARQIERRSGPALDRWWKDECRRLQARLQAQGLSPREVKAEIDRFALAVHAEMQRAAWAAYYQAQPSDGGHAA